MIHNSIFEIIFLFMIYSFLGWIVEVIHRSITQRRLVNAGFLFGPFLPIYGFGAMIALFLDQILKDSHVIINLLIIGIMLSVIEYITGSISERLFKIKLWDYEDRHFNINGKVSLFYSIIWTLLAFLFLNYIHPVASAYIKVIDSNIIIVVSISFVLYFSADLFASIMSLKAFRIKIAYLYDNYINLNNPEIYKIVKSFNRLVRAFPDINKYINEKIGNKIRDRINSLMLNLSQKIQENFKTIKPFDNEYYSYVNDILSNQEFQKLKGFFHHNATIYEHTLDVSYISYQLCRNLKLDFKSAARGGLLHDFFLYDWRKYDPSRKRFHGLWHAGLALKNAEKEFTLNDTEKDIIIKHMWPLTPVPPRYKESFIVNFVDKYVSSREFLSEIKKKIREK